MSQRINEGLPLSDYYFNYLQRASTSSRHREQNMTNEQNKLSAFERSAIIHVLSQVIFKLDIVSRGIYSREKAEEVNTKTRLPMSERFKSPILDKLYDESTLVPLKNCFETISRTKLSMDIEAMKCAFEMCKEELENHSSMKQFTDFVHSEFREANDEFKLLQKYAELTSKSRLLREQLKEIRQNVIVEKEKMDQRLNEVKTDFDEDIIKSRMELELIEKWETSRQQQCKIMFQHEIDLLNEKQQKYSTAIDRELIAFNAIQTFYASKCEKLRHSIALRTRKYADERAQLDKNIEATQANIDRVDKECKEIENVHKQRNEFIENYRREKKLRLERRELENKQCAAAIRVQSWWRATMVRNQLGRYRVKKKTKKTKKK